jgi:hypothetical protein
MNAAVRQDLDPGPQVEVFQAVMVEMRRDRAAFMSDARLHMRLKRPEEAKRSARNARRVNQTIVRIKVLFLRDLP